MLVDSLSKKRVFDPSFLMRKLLIPLLTELAISAINVEELIELKPINHHIKFKSYK